MFDPIKNWLWRSQTETEWNATATLSDASEMTFKFSRWSNLDNVWTLIFYRGATDRPCPTAWIKPNNFLQNEVYAGISHCLEEFVKMQNPAMMVFHQYNDGTNSAHEYIANRLVNSVPYAVFCSSKGDAMLTTCPAQQMTTIEMRKFP